MKIILSCLLLTVVLNFININHSFAQDTYKNQFLETVENDQYVNAAHDRYYTEGTLLTFSHLLNPAKKADSKLVKKILEFQSGQQIYTPYKADVPDPTKQDRPFTGYLYLGAGLNWLYSDESQLHFNVQIGTIGPNSQAERIQTDFHDSFGLYKPQGWQYQLNNEAGLNLDLNYKKLLFRTPDNWFDLTANPDAWLGNTFTGASAGLIFRLGQLGKLYQSAITNSRVGSNDEHQKHEFYFFTEPQIDYVAYNATIEGGLFIKDKGPVTFGIYHYVYVQQFGAQFVSARWSLNYSVFIKSREVKSTALGDQYGSINIAYRFGKI